MKFRFTWEPEKAKQNRKKHFVAFEEAVTVFDDPLSLTIPDELHSEAEDRFIILGESTRGRILVVVHSEDETIVRIISARVATSHERTEYEEGR